MPLFFMISAYDFGQEGKTPFAPTLKYTIVEAMIDDTDHHIDNLIDEILSKEKDIISNNEYVSDWGTRLGKNSLTSRSNSYNLLNFDNASIIKESIVDMHRMYLEMCEESKDSKKYYVQCWANVMRSKEKIFPHRHCPNEYSYLSGHICLQVNDTFTHYIDPISDVEWKSPNVNNKITVFPSFVKHYTDSVPLNQTRITLAFDIINKEAYDKDIVSNKKSHWIELE